MYSCRLLQNVTVKPQMAVCNDREQPQYAKYVTKSQTKNFSMTSQLYQAPCPLILSVLRFYRDLGYEAS